MEWQKKLFDHEENPPGEIWNKISAKLGEEPWFVRKNLGNFEAAPPAPVWEELSAKLEAENFKNRKSLLKVIRLKPVRIAVAAALAGAIVLAAYYFISNSQLIKPSDIAANMIDSQKSSNARIEKTNPEIVRSGSEGKDNKNTLHTDEAQKDTEQPVDQVAVDTKPGKAEQRKYSPARLAKLNFNIRPDELSKRTHLNKIGNDKNEIAFPKAKNFAPGYVTVIGDNGATYRVSSKVRDIIHYMQGADNQFSDQRDRFVSENNYWQSIFREWKKKVSSAAFIPDSGNFLDIMELMQLIQQNK